MFQFLNQNLDDQIDQQTKHKKKCDEQVPISFIFFKMVNGS